MKTLLVTLLACLALGLVVAGCGDDNDDGDSAAAPETQEQPAEPAATEEEPTGGGASAEPAEVSMKDISFQPADVTVPKGGTVTWTNDDSVGHDVTKTGGPGPDFKSGDPGGMASGDTFEETFDKPGKIDYVCTVHPGMEGTVTVK